MPFTEIETISRIIQHRAPTHAVASAPGSSPFLVAVTSKPITTRIHKALRNKKFQKCQQCTFCIFIPGIGIVVLVLIIVFGFFYGNGNGNLNQFYPSG